MSAHYRPASGPSRSLLCCAGEAKKDNGEAVKRDGELDDDPNGDKLAAVFGRTAQRTHAGAKLNDD